MEDMLLFTYRLFRNSGANVGLTKKGLGIKKRILQALVSFNCVKIIQYM